MEELLVIGGFGEELGRKIQEFGVDYPGNPRFKVSMSESLRGSIETSFYFINSNSKWLRRNFEFIQAIFAGTSWVHMEYCMIRPTNIYHVLCPGRFQIYWAAMNAEVTFEGKLRKKKNVSDELNAMGVKSIDADMLWPDAWKIKLNIRDLTPNNFNLYADYYQNGYVSDEVAELADQISVNDMVGELQYYIVELANKMDPDLASDLNDVASKMTGKKMDMEYMEAGLSKDAVIQDMELDQDGNQTGYTKTSDKKMSAENQAKLDSYREEQNAKYLQSLRDQGYQV